MDLVMLSVLLMNETYLPSKLQKATSAKTTEKLDICSMSFKRVNMNEHLFLRCRHYPVLVLLLPQ